MRRWVVRVVVILLVLAMVAMVGAYWWARPILLTATGYAAHNACAVQHLAGRPDPAADLPANPLVPYLTVRADADATRASILGLLAAQRAWFIDGFGCTLADAPPRLGPAATVTPGALATRPAAAASEAVEAAVARAFGDDLDAAARGRLGTRAVVVLHRGELVAERYADGFDAGTRQLGWSMAKSVTHLLTGRLVHRGLVDPTETGLRPEWTDERSAISIDHLLRMTSGLAWDETYDLGTPITRMLYLEPDMAAFVAGQPAAHPPGTYQQYASGNTNLLCSLLAERADAGADLPRRELFAPLGLASAVWEPDAAGTPVCSSYLWATPRDWAALGQFALQDGVWEGERLLPEGWLAAGTTVEPVATTEEVGYAAGWWANALPDGTRTHAVLPADAYWASGHDGQRLYVVPSEELVVVRLGFSPGVPAAGLRANDLVAELVDALP